MSFVLKVAGRVKIVEFCVMFAREMMPVLSWSIRGEEVVEQHQN